MVVGIRANDDIPMFYFMRRVVMAGDIVSVVFHVHLSSKSDVHFHFLPGWPLPFGLHLDLQL